LSAAGVEDGVEDGLLILLCEPTPTRQSGVTSSAEVSVRLIIPTPSAFTAVALGNPLVASHEPHPNRRADSTPHRVGVRSASSSDADEILGTSVLPFRQTLAYLIYHQPRRAVLLEPAD
jgi:hypothetical protein